MQSTNSEQQLQDALMGLPKEKQPQRDLFKGIELALEKHADDMPKASDKKPIWLASAASFAVLASLSWFNFNATQDESDFVNESAALVQALSEQHRDHVDTLLVKFDGQPVVSENWKQQLEELDEAAGAIKLALKEDPANTALLKMLQQIYQQQIVLIERVHAPKWQQI